MKYVQTYESYINEVRVTAKPYAWTKVPTTRYSAEFSFSTEAGENYAVFFAPSDVDVEGQGYDVAFETDTAKEEDTMVPLTNKGEQYKVFATIMDIIKEFIATAETDFDFVGMYGSAKNDEENDGQFDGLITQRTRVYQRLLKANFPEHRIETVYNHIVIWVRE